MVDFSRLKGLIAQCLRADQSRLYQRLAQIRSLRNLPEQETQGQALRTAIENSFRRCRARADLPLNISYPEELPVAQKRHDIAAALKAHPLIIVAGQTGSGKTTQLPKICLELGRGIHGMIGHTQPRRIAARTLSWRIAEEIGNPTAVGFKIRFQDLTRPQSRIKVMTDGILLAETQHDRLLEHYDTLIIDEAHERSLNIDFLLGYIRQLLPRRPDLKVIITSATIDSERFSRHFHGAPVIEVSGRTYPVEVRYRPLQEDDAEEEDRDKLEAISMAVDELSAQGPGDILVFMHSEREIRETTEALRKHHPNGSEILPLYGRLSAEEQSRVFRPGPRRRIVLATNVAETSLTVPGIRYVIDPGEARISRYSPRTKVQRLPIEPVSRASADQRKGRCGRLGPGICIRLYSEKDFLERPAYTDPEILRTNLASVILQMLALQLGKIENFAFLDPPDVRMIRDGYQTLLELGAVDAQQHITMQGKQLARLPVDPRIARMILAAKENAAIHEVLIIGAALSIQDPRERPLEAQEKADLSHRRFRVEGSDFLAYMELWKYFHDLSKTLSQSQLRKRCKQEYLSYLRLREWQDIHQQLHALVTEMGLRPNEVPADEGAIHRALLAGLLSNIGCKAEGSEYQGTRQGKFHIFPGSSLHNLGTGAPPWIMAAEMVETSRSYARTVGRIQMRWIEPLAEHLVKRTYSEPTWDASTAHVMAFEKVTLYGLVIHPRRRVHYGPIEPKVSREIFIRHALVEGEFRSQALFLKKNRELLEQVRQKEAKTRENQLAAEPVQIYDFYLERLPAGITNGPEFESWVKSSPAHKALEMTLSDAMRPGAQTELADPEAFPDFLQIGQLRLPLTYRMAPGESDDGVTLQVPVGALGILRPERVDELIPGWLEEKILSLLRGLPGSLRKHVVPVPEYTKHVLTQLPQTSGRLLRRLSDILAQATGVEIPIESWRESELPDYLRMNVRVIDPEGKILMEGRDLPELQQRLAKQLRNAWGQLHGGALQRDQMTQWQCGELPETIEVHQQGMILPGYPALVDQETGVGVRVFATAQLADQAMGPGLRRLFMLQVQKELRHLVDRMTQRTKLELYYWHLGTPSRLKAELMAAIVDRAFSRGPLRSAAEFNAALDAGRQRLTEIAGPLEAQALAILERHHTLGLQIEEIKDLHRAEARAELREQLDHLVGQDFLTRLDALRLSELPRYLEAMSNRLRKLQGRDLDRDAAFAEQIYPFWEDYLRRREIHRQAGIDDPQLALFRWMIEEFRVSLFAPELKTPMPISRQRLERQWALVQS